MMDKRHSSEGYSPRPRAYRKRSNSFPIVEALGCSTPEAELVLAEGKAAVRSRKASRRMGLRMKDEMETFKPRYHMKYLYRGSPSSAVEEEDDDDDDNDDDNDDVSEGSLLLGDIRDTRHSRIPSNATEKSSSTIVPVQPPVDAPRATSSPISSALEDYSANLAKFIQSQLNTIPSYRPTHSSISPCSCPGLTFRSPSQSPQKPRSPSDVPLIIEMPAVRPPLKSEFSAWSSTDDDTDEEVPPFLDAKHQRKDSIAENHTPPVLRYHEGSNGSSFLLPSTPLEEEQPDTAKGVSFPDQAALPGSSTEPHQDSHADDDCRSPIQPQLTSSPAPSFSSTSTGSYFEHKRPFLTPQIRDRIIAAVTPPPDHTKVIPAISPFEGGELANIHDVLIESQQRVHVDGMSFDMLRDFTTPDEGRQRVPPC